MNHTMKPANHYIAKGVATFCFSLVLVVLASTVLSWLSVGPVRLDPLVVVAVACGFTFPLVGGSILVGLTGLLLDLLSSGILGLNVFSLLVVLVLCTATRRKLDIDSWPFQIVMVFIMSLLSQVIVFGGLVLLARPTYPIWNLAIIFAAQAFFTALTAPIFFTGLEGFNWFFIKIFSKMGITR